MTDYIYDDEGELINAGERYDDWLDLDGEVEVAGLSFYPSRIIKELDPIAYRCGFNDYMDGAKQDELLGEAVIRVLTEDGEVESVTMYREVDDALEALAEVYAELDSDYAWTVQVVDNEELVAHEGTKVKSAA